MSFSAFKKLLDSIILTGIISACGMGISYIAKMSENIQMMTVSVQILTEKLTNIDRIAQDHESRIRNLESQKKPR